MEKIWKEIKGYEGFYEVSNDGCVRSLDRFVYGRIEGYKALKKGKVLSPGVSNRGYLRVLLSKEQVRVNIPVHRLVALAFIENPLCHPQVNHKNGDKRNNTVENLEWCDQTYNNRHARAAGLNVARSGKESHSYGFKNKQSHVLINTVTKELKPIVEVAKEYPQWTRRHITMMVMGERTNKTSYALHL